MEAERRVPAANFSFSFPWPPDFSAFGQRSGIPSRGNAGPPIDEERMLLQISEPSQPWQKGFPQEGFLTGAASSRAGSGNEWHKWRRRGGRMPERFYERTYFPSAEHTGSPVPEYRESSKAGCAGFPWRWRRHGSSTLLPPTRGGGGKATYFFQEASSRIQTAREVSRKIPEEKSVRIFMVAR